VVLRGVVAVAVTTAAVATAAVAAAVVSAVVGSSVSGNGGGIGGGGGGGSGEAGGVGVKVTPLSSHLFRPQQPTKIWNHAPILKWLLSHMHENNSYAFHAPYAFG
jgi:hypothetical protein